MELYLKEELVRKIALSGKKGLLAGERFYDIFYVYDILGGADIKEVIQRQETKESLEIIGEYIFLKKGKIIQKKTLFKKSEIQWIKVIVIPKNSAGRKKQQDIRNSYQVDAFMNTLDEDQRHMVVNSMKIVIV
ncbi:MAG: hypothetical protein A2Y62_15525 [Candidatus Fischerbacteria bacterium RBG_13_37_8]|uniref:Uncharacterized protein n=1 Tax=Candidatus Fischerbacteria bacterium RBG_13_37_8 TaxID=1817863 RepID=A0A1F5VLE3_9BACT|nr:MAG: hypothetical protein A2Y62_15525 [Candidatus Fischerbacteria bacterium RBG_13_37_8]